MNKRAAAFLCAMMLILLLFTQASAQAAVVNDTAAVLSTVLTTEITELSGLLEENLGIALRVETRHFLGGKEVQAYTDQMLNDMPEHDNLILLVMVIGEENYAVALGEKAKALLGKEKTENLLLNWFREPYLKDRAYDRALAAFLLALTDHLQTAAGKTLPPNKLLQGFAGQTAALPVSTVKPASATSWLDGIFPDVNNSIKNADRYAQEAQQAEKGGSGGLSLFQIALIGFVLYKIFGKRKDGKRGCGPLGWIFGTWGASKIFGWRK